MTDARRLGEERKAELQARHHAAKIFEYQERRCPTCMVAWPCDAAILLGQIAWMQERIKTLEKEIARFDKLTGFRA